MTLIPRIDDFTNDPVSRRDATKTLMARAGLVGLWWLGAKSPVANGAAALGGARLSEPPRAKNVILCYMSGGVSQVDTFDPKPRLAVDNGKPFPMTIEATQFDNNGAVLASPWKFRRYGESGLPVSELFPHVGRLADDLCVIRSMKSDFPEHGQANYFFHTGHAVRGRPSAGAWVSYALQQESSSLPGFVVLNGGCVPAGGVGNYANGFLPAPHRGLSLNTAPDQAVLNNLERGDEPTAQAAKLKLIQRMNREALASSNALRNAIETDLRNYESATRLQTEVPDLLDLSGESTTSMELYGIGSRHGPTAAYARQCLLARRLVERGVRFVEISMPQPTEGPWDQHGKLKEGHEKNALAVDQPIAGLLIDLKQRGLLDETLVVWAGEFGRTPFAQGKDGRDHNPQGFTIWLAGGGVRAGYVHGATDEFGYHAVDQPMTIYDLHATILHQLGFNHEKLTYRFGGRDMRLTDVHGAVQHRLLA